MFLLLDQIINFCRITSDAPTVTDEMPESYGIQSRRIEKHEVHVWLVSQASIP